MFVCLECGHAFEDHKQYESESREHFGFPCREKWIGCPVCSSGSSAEAFLCDICNEYILDDYYEVGDMKVCVDCCIKKNLVEECS